MGPRECGGRQWIESLAEEEEQLQHLCHRQSLESRVCLFLQLKDARRAGDLRVGVAISLPASD